jgi:chaperonin GroEL (HSP60 family)
MLLNLLSALAVNDNTTKIKTIGVDKIIVDSINRVIVTHSGSTILQQLSIAHPIAKVIIKSIQENEKRIGDGATTLMIILNVAIQEVSIRFFILIFRLKILFQ